MPIDKVTATQFADLIRSGITSRDADADTGFGPIREIVIDPVADVLEEQNDRLRQVSLLISLTNESEFSTEDVESIVFNEGLIRIDGSQATGTVTFARSSAPTSDATVARGFPITTRSSEASGQAVTFVTTEAKTLPVASASSYFNAATGKYELIVPVIALVTGSRGRVGPNRVTQPLRPLINFDTVTNKEAISEDGADQESNAQLIDRYQLSIIGRQLATPSGVIKFIRDNYIGVSDALAVYGTDSLLTRAATDVGAVDLYIIAEGVTQITENLSFLSVGQTIAIASPPIVSVLSVSNVTAGASLDVGDDYTVILDTSGVAGSTRAMDGIQIAPNALPLPAAGDTIQVTYTYNTLVRTLQSVFAQEDLAVFGQDLLIRAATEVPIVIQATVRVIVGYNPTSISSLVSTALISFADGLGLGDDVEASDLQAVVRAISGVDNFIIARLTRATTASGTSDIVINRSEYARLSSANLVLTVS